MAASTADAPCWANMSLQRKVTCISKLVDMDSNSTPSIYICYECTSAHITVIVYNYNKVPLLSSGNTDHFNVDSMKELFEKVQADSILAYLKEINLFDKF